MYVNSRGSGVARIFPRRATFIGPRHYYQKLKTHRIWPTIFLGGSQNHKQEKVKTNNSKIMPDLGTHPRPGGPHSCFRTPKSMREPTPELNGSLKGGKSFLKF